jgi:hypothetical protein
MLKYRLYNRFGLYRSRVSLVPIPKVLANVAIPDGGNLVAMRNEPVLAKGRVFVGTGSGHVYMLEP